MILSNGALGRTRASSEACVSRYVAVDTLTFFRRLNWRPRASSKYPLAAWISSTSSSTSTTTTTIYILLPLALHHGLVLRLERVAHHMAHPLHEDSVPMDLARDDIVEDDLQAAIDLSLVHGGRMREEGDQGLLAAGAVVAAPGDLETLEQGIGDGLL
eukprot:16431053-Heterocapsa_arctica.AAC.1